MIVYLDASALVKRYISEAGSADVGDLVEGAALVGTSILSRVEVSAAFAKASRMKLVSSKGALEALNAFKSDWESFVRLQVNEALAARAADIAWNQGLRGCDAAHLAAAHWWQDVMGEPVTVATFDRQLGEAAGVTGLVIWP